MSLEFNLPKEKSSIIKVIGVGGAGTNAVNHMLSKGINGVNFIVANTDEQHLEQSPVTNKIQLGPEITGGNGTGANPDIGRQATEESLEVLREELANGTKMIFIAAGMGKGTGTGGSPVIAKLAKEMGLLTVGIVSTPMSLLGKSAKAKSENGIQELKKHLDSLIIVSNDKILKEYKDKKISDAYALGDEILCNAAKGISEIITGNGIHNTDFNDVKMVLQDGGMTIMGIGYGEGETRAKEAVVEALQSPLISDYDIKGAKNALVNISYSSTNECTMDEVEEVFEAVRSYAQSDMEIIFGTSIDETLQDELAVTIVVTGFDEEMSTVHEVSSAKFQVAEPKVETVEHIESTPIQPEVEVVEKDNSFEIEAESHQVEFIVSEEEQESEETAEDDGALFRFKQDNVVDHDEMGRIIGETLEEKNRRILGEMSMNPAKKYDFELSEQEINDANSSSSRYITLNDNIIEDRDSKFNNEKLD